MERGTFERQLDDLLVDLSQEDSVRQRDLDTAMRAEDERRLLFESRIQGLRERLLAGRVEEVVSRFPNGRLRWTDSPGMIHAECEFEHTKEMPSTTTLDISLEPADEFRTLRAVYRLRILPVFMDYERFAEVAFPADRVDEVALAAWIENRLLEFVRTYLRIRTHPGYHHSQLVTDPVCQMTFAIGAAAARLEQGGRTFYFCSLHCRDAFLRHSPGGG